MKKIILLFLILFFIPQAVFSADDEVSKTFNVGPGESVSFYIYRLDGQIHAEITARGMFYSAFLWKFYIRQDGQEYGLMSYPGFNFYNADGEYVAVVYTGDTEYVTIEKDEPYEGEEKNNLNLSKEFNLVSTYDLDFLTVPGKSSGGGGGGGGSCFILNLVK